MSTLPAPARLPTWARKPHPLGRGTRDLREARPETDDEMRDVRSSFDADEVYREGGVR